MKYCFQIHFWEFLTFSFNYNNQKHQFGGWGVPPGHPQQINKNTLSSSLASQYNTSLLCCWGCFVVFWGVFCRLFLVFSYTAPREQLRESVAAHPQLQMTQSETGSHQRRSSPPNCPGANNKVLEGTGAGRGKLPRARRSHWVTLLFLLFTLKCYFAFWGKIINNWVQRVNQDAYECKNVFRDEM